MEVRSGGRAGFSYRPVSLAQQQRSLPSCGGEGQSRARRRCPTTSWPKTSGAADWCACSKNGEASKKTSLPSISNADISPRRSSCSSISSRSDSSNDDLGEAARIERPRIAGSNTATAPRPASSCSRARLRSACGACAMSACLRCLIGLVGDRRTSACRAAWTSCAVTGFASRKP